MTVSKVWTRGFSAPGKPFHPNRPEGQKQGGITMYSVFRSFLFAGAALAATIVTSVTVARGQVACGDVVATKVAMTADLACATDPGFTISAGGSVDMVGHKLTACGGCIGVELNAPGASIANGWIVGSGVGSMGILIMADKNKVENIVVTGSESGVRAIGSKTKISNCSAYGVSLGFVVSGTKNVVRRCQSTGALTNFTVLGDGNSLAESVSSDASSVGILISGTANKLSRNASNRDGQGFYLNGSENKTTLNTSTGSLAGTGFAVVGDENKVTKTTVADTVSQGLLLFGNLNQISKSTFVGNDANGVTISGNENSVTGCNANNNSLAGIEIYGDANVLKANVTMKNTLNGVLLPSATNSSVTKSVALGNGDPDLQDNTANCGTNVWADNVFGSSEADNVAAHICIH